MNSVNTSPSHLKPKAPSDLRINVAGLKQSEDQLQRAVNLLRKNQVAWSRIGEAIGTSRPEAACIWARLSVASRPIQALQKSSCVGAVLRRGLGGRRIDPILHLDAEVTSEFHVEALRELCNAVVGELESPRPHSDRPVRGREDIALVPKAPAADRSQHLATEYEREVGAEHPLGRSPWIDHPDLGWAGLQSRKSEANQESPMTAPTLTKSTSSTVHVCWEAWRLDPRPPPLQQP